MPITIFKIKSDQYKDHSYLDIVQSMMANDSMILNNDGLHHVRNLSSTKPFTEEEIAIRTPLLDKCKTLVPLLVTKKKQHLIGSYQFKHVVENLVSENYVSNGEIILVMIALGYSIQWYNTGVNCDLGCVYAKSDVYNAMRLNDEVVHHCQDVHKF